MKTTLSESQQAIPIFVFFPFYCFEPPHKCGDRQGLHIVRDEFD